MRELVNQFKTQKYTHLSNFLDKDSCVELTIQLKNIIARGETSKDSQCPLSKSIHGAPVFDSLLNQLLPIFETVSDKKLYPTYSYARLYNPGEELKIHTDRPSCEISATLTLGFEGGSWPIYMGDEGGTNASKIMMDVGDAVLYRGCDKYHWREPYKEGKWQAQVFLHYVDVNGSHAEWKHDRRVKTKTRNITWDDE